ncbi:proline racemase family protein [Rubripirellula reticaptiva]|uniref:4-hydroxyproline epimerase n=1 Tax=Rubripirellula reticaptiva TaxID=2528013 RepID=A0A5C6F8A0_9BACT|nr:proline racemase family protein [Rubripirellula reticaptiva]TWU56346.1 4-hydroxyproline epimerase [Rubripirellula reticaptiva]
MQRLSIIDTHTGGEPTRVVIDVVCDHGPSASASPAERWSWLRGPGDWVRRSILLEPRGCESMVGALVSPSDDPSCLTSVIFFNNTGYLGMCGHGLIGVVEALRFSEDLKPGSYQLETPVGVVRANLHENHQVTFENVPSFRLMRQVAVQIPVQDATKNFGNTVVGDIAYGGNWFFLVSLASLNLDSFSVLTRPEWLQFCVAIMDALADQGITGVDGAEIDHIEICGPLEVDNAQGIRGGRNFVLCPGGHYDRSPCGTGTSAKIACLADDGNLLPGEVWIQESIIGSRFEATYRRDSAGIRVSITGRAHVTGKMTCVFDPDDPFRFGLPVNCDKTNCDKTNCDGTQRQSPDGAGPDPALEAAS